MAKRIITVVVLIVLCWLGYSWYQQRKAGVFSFQEPELTTIIRGDLEIPVSATGSIKPALALPLKPKASGTVTNVYVKPGDMVKKGDLLVKLDPVDEQRTVDNAETEVARATETQTLEEHAAKQISNDWETGMEFALSALDSTRAELRRTVKDLRWQESARLGQNADDIPFNIVDVEKVKTRPLDKAPVHPVVNQCARELSIANAEIDVVTKLVDACSDILSNPDESFEHVSKVEYQTYTIQAWQALANVRSQSAGVREAVNKYALIDQAKTRVKLAGVGVRKAQVALEQAKQRLTETEVFSPIDGQVQEVNARVGQVISSAVATVTGGTILMTLADISKLYVDADVDEADIGRVRDLVPADRPATQPTAGPAEDKENIDLLQSADQVKITVDAFREELFTGVVDRIYPSARIANNVVTYNVRILLTSENRTLLYLGMHANVDFTARKYRDVLMVDIEAIKLKNDQRGVYIPGKPITGTVGRPKPVFVPVKLGFAGPDMIELRTDKLKAGQEVYTKLPGKTREEEEAEENED